MHSFRANDCQCNKSAPSEDPSEITLFVILISKPDAITFEFRYGYGGWKERERNEKKYGYRGIIWIRVNNTIRRNNTDHTGEEYGCGEIIRLIRGNNTYTKE